MVRLKMFENEQLEKISNLILSDKKKKALNSRLKFKIKCLWIF